MGSNLKVIGVLSCGFLLCLGLSNAAKADGPPSAVADMNASQYEREGGQAGLKGEEDKLTGDPIPSQSGRKGGQAGLKGAEDKLDGSHITIPEREGGQAGSRGDQDKLKGLKGSRTIKGEVLSVEGDIYYLQEQNGKAVRLHTDKTTRKIGNIHEGISIEAEVNDRGHALSIRSAESSDRRNEADRKG
ncbi:MAG TPA: hypothetical protein VLL06_08300 [Nitrospiraceae bacterium]|nr:hypothetical protein [Nitrospiraceae bacterium]